MNDTLDIKYDNDNSYNHNNNSFYLVLWEYDNFCYFCHYVS